MNISGTIFKVLPLESGDGKNGTWKKQSTIIEIDNGKYPKKVAVTFWGDLVADRMVGSSLDVEIDIESREYNTKWYTDVKVWRVNSDTKKSDAIDSLPF